MPSKKKILFLFGIIFGLRLVLIYESLLDVQFWLTIMFGIFTFVLLNYVDNLFVNYRKTFLISMEKLTEMIERKVNSANGHSVRVGRLARQVAEQLKLSQEEIDAIHYAALWHDIGEMQLDDRILKKRGPLTVEEEQQFRRHPEFGAKLIERVPGFSKAADYVRHHHEQWDGKGYPEGKREKEIPLGARIITVVNEYDYLMNKLKVKDPKQTFLRLAGKKLDPELVQLLVQIVDFKPEAELENNQITEEKPSLKVKKKFTKSKLLRDFGMGQFVFYQNGSFFNTDGVQRNIPCENEVMQLLKTGQEGVLKHEFVEDAQTGETFNINWIEIENIIYVLIFDVSHFLEYEQKQELKIHILYRDVIHSVTNGKLLLLDSEQLDNYYKGDMLFEAVIQESEDVAVCRKLVGEILEARHVEGKKKYNILLSISEAVTNILKHATEGKMKVYLNENILRIIVEDNGNGIKLKDLPKSTLIEGYSNKRSMGQGFAIMIKMMDRIALYTSKEGAIVILESALTEKRH